MYMHAILASRITSSEQGVADVGLDRQHGSKANHRCARVHELGVGGERAEGLLLGAEAGGDQRCRDEQGEEGKDASGLLGHLAEDTLTCKRGEDRGAEVRIGWESVYGKAGHTGSGGSEYKVAGTISLLLS